MFKIQFLTGICLVASSSILWAAPPSAQNIVQWINNIDVSSADPARAIKIESTKEITTYTGEKAYLSSVYFENSARNFWGGYVLTRPNLRQSHILEFGGQANKFQIYPVYINERHFDLIEFNSSASGQGAIESTKTLAYIQNGNVKILRELGESSYEGRYSDVLDDIDCKTGSDNSAYFNVMEYHGYVLETTITADGCESKNVKDYKIKTELIPLKIPK